MKIKIMANEVTEGEIDFISLVKHGANRSPFKIMKHDEPASSLIDQCPELAKLQRSLAAESAVQKESTKVKIKDAIKGLGGPAETVQKSGRSNAEITEITEITEIVKHRRRKAALNARLFEYYENPNGTPNGDRVELYLLDEIEKCDIELEALGYQDPDQFAESSAFFFRGGSSVNSPITDSAFENVTSLGVAKQVDVRKAEQMIDLNPNPLGVQTDDNEVAKIDLSGMKL